MQQDRGWWHPTCTNMDSKGCWEGDCYIIPCLSSQLPLFSHVLAFPFLHPSTILHLFHSMNCAIVYIMHYHLSCKFVVTTHIHLKFMVVDSIYRSKGCRDDSAKEHRNRMQAKGVMMA